jgi:tetratricopeptide (TPR) repeat protein
MGKKRVSNFRPAITLALLMLFLTCFRLYAQETLVDQALTLADQGNLPDAIDLLQESLAQQPDNSDWQAATADLLIRADRLSEADVLISGPLSGHDAYPMLRSSWDKKLSRAVTNDKIVTVFVQKRIELRDFKTAILVLDQALLKFPKREADFFTLKGEALYKMNELEAAEAEFRAALLINPLNPVAKAYVNEIRTTLEAQTSTAWAEFVSIAKDKFGDFVVTFLALLTAFIFNAAFSPLWMRYRLFRARRAFIAGDYDDFADAIEALLDQEDFKPLRDNFRMLLKSNTYESMKDIFEHHIMTADRLPTLLRILERENEKMYFSREHVEYDRRQRSESRAST